MFETYKGLRSDAGYMYDWDDLAYYAYHELLNDTDDRRYDHIIVDEGQDFSPMMIKTLTIAASKTGSFSFLAMLLNKYTVLAFRGGTRVFKLEKIKSGVSIEIIETHPTFRHSPRTLQTAIIGIVKKT